VELVQLNPPTGMTCAQYLNPFISSAGGYLMNADATTACSFCSMSTADQFLASGFNIFYDHAWRNFGLMFAYIIFNVRLALLLVSIAQTAYRSCSCTSCTSCSVYTAVPCCPTSAKSQSESHVHIHTSYAFIVFLAPNI